MTSKAQRRRNKKMRAQGQEGNSGTAPAEKLRSAPHGAYLGASEPTEQRRRRGVWIEGRTREPYVDLATDMIGALYQAGKITVSQEQAARLFQQLRAGYVAELETPGFKSCLAGGVGGHNDSDGNVAAVVAYNSLCEKIGRVKAATLRVECDKLADEKPVNLRLLTLALDSVREGP